MDVFYQTANYKPAVTRSGDDQLLLCPVSKTTELSKFRILYLYGLLMDSRLEAGLVEAIWRTYLGQQSVHHLLKSIRSLVTL